MSLDLPRWGTAGRALRLGASPALWALLFLAVAPSPAAGEGGANGAPRFSAISHVREHLVAAAVVTAVEEDAQDEIRHAVLSGPDAAHFEIGFRNGGAVVVAFASPPNFEDPRDVGRDNVYEFDLRVSSGVGNRTLSASRHFSVRVTDRPGEAPRAPDGPTRVGATAGSMSVAWREPENAGPPIVRYDLSYRPARAGGDFANWPEEITGLQATVIGLGPDMRYEVRVRAVNADGRSPWSEVEEVRTQAAAAPDPSPEVAPPGNR